MKKSMNIWGAMEQGLAIKRALEANGEFVVKSFIDNDKRLSGSCFDGTPICSFDQYVKEGDGDICLATPYYPSMIDMIRQSNLKIKLYGIRKCYHKNSKDIINELAGGNVKDYLYEMDYSKPRLFMFQYHVNDHCNLKCKGCSHFSNLVTGEKFSDFEQYKKDLARLKELVCGIRTISLMGGEPLLNPRLPDFIYETNRVFPDCQIVVTTNGLLIPTLGDEVFESMRFCDAQFVISWYKPTDNLLPKIKCKCWEEGINYSLASVDNKPIESFWTKWDLHGLNNPEESWESCKGSANHTCAALRDGKMAICFNPVLMAENKEALDFELDISEEDVIDIYDKQLDGFALAQKLDSPIPLCRYCRLMDESRCFQWEGNYPYKIVYSELMK